MKGIIGILAIAAVGAIQAPDWDLKRDVMDNQKKVWNTSDVISKMFRFIRAILALQKSVKGGPFN